jgi:hypothetical protein
MGSNCLYGLKFLQGVLADVQRKIHT